MNLNNIKYINKFRRLNYPKNKMLIVGSGSMALFGLKKNNDIDIWTTEDVLQKISKDPQFVLKKSRMDGSNIYQTKDESIEIGSTLPPFKDTVIDHLRRSIIIYGIHFQSLQDVLIWKRMVNRPKDRKDIEIIEEFLKNNVVENYLNSLNKLI